MKTKRGLITVLILTIVAAAMMIPLIGDVAVEAQNPPGASLTPTPAPVGGIVEPVDLLEQSATSGEPSDGASASTFIALGIGIAVLLAALIVWSVRRRRVA